MKELIKDTQYRIRAFLLLILDIIAIIASSFIALSLRFEFHFNMVDIQYVETLYRYLPINIACTIIIFFLLRMYTSLWKYASVRELSNVVIASILSGVVQLIGMFYILRWSMPRSYFVVYTMLLLLLEFGIRFGYRFFRFLRNEIGGMNEVSHVMVIGAGDAGAAIIKEIRLSKFVNQKVVCVIDDDPGKIHHYIEGCRVEGDRNTILENVEKYGIEKIIIAIPTASKKPFVNL